MILFTILSFFLFSLILKKKKMDDLKAKMVCV